MTIHDATHLLRKSLDQIYDPREAANIASLVMERVTALNRMDRIMERHSVLAPEMQKALATYTQELMQHRPVQYVLNEAWFFGIAFFVNENVLIPRPETEELVQWVLENRDVEKAGFSILDIGTGSGCIPISLKTRLPEASVFACDYSEEALAVARRNSDVNNTGINFFICDVLDAEAVQNLPSVDLIVSNPPYIALKDKLGVQQNVREYEPHSALFVPDDDPLLFYRAIVGIADKKLNDGGSIYVEVDEKMANDAATLFRESGFNQVQIRKDMNERDRMISASRR